mgnify:CR=1 FL=1
MNVMLSTIDNPYDPFDDFKNWFLFDVQHGYNSCAYLARIAQTSEQFTEKENFEEIEKAIDEIIELDFMNIYKKVVKYIELEDYLKERNSSYESATDVVKE